MVDAQKWLLSREEYNTKEKRKNIEELNISSEGLDGCLDLRDFASLQELDCSKNQLIELDLTNCVQLEKVDCSGNCLQDLKLPSQIEQLTELSIRGNNFDRNIYDCLRDLVESKNLKRLDVVIIDRKVNNQLEASTSKYNDDQEEESYEEVDAQEYLNKKYPEGKRSWRKSLDLSNLKVKLKGSLSLDGFVKLNKLECQNNLLERLVIPDSCFRLTHLDCSGNLLTDLSFLNQSCLKNKLIYLDISDNNFFNKIICFKHFVSLEVLKINAVDLDKQIGGIYEYFYHHLKENKGIINLKKLKEEDHFGLVDVEKKLNEQEVLKKDLLIKQLIKKLENEELSSSRKAQIIEIVEKTNLSESCSSLEDERKFFNELISNVSNNTTQGERMTQITYICNYGQLSTGSNITFFSNQSNQTTYQIQYNIQQPQKELNELKQKYQVLESAEKQNNQSDQQKLKKAVLFLGAKQIFADTRQDTIKKIINTYKELDESGQKFDKVKTVGEHISSAKWIADFAPTPGAGTAVDLLGKGISAVANIFKNSSLDRHAQKFEDYLIGDAKAILFLEETYQSLANSQNDQRKINPLITEILKLNQSQFSSHDIFEVSGIQKEEPPTAEKMVKAIDLLTEDLEKFAQELKQEKDQYAEKIKTFFSDEDNNTLQAELIELLKKLSEKESENGSTQSSTSTYSQSQSIRLNQGQAKQREDLQKQIISKKTSLEQLIISAKEKLKSTSKFSDTKRKEREKKLELLFKNLPATSEEFIKSLESIKTGLSGKLTKEEVNELCQKQVELMKLQIELENLQKQEQKPLQIQPPYGTPGSR